MSENLVKAGLVYGYLKKILQLELSSVEYQWLTESCNLLQKKEDQSDFFLRFSSVPRFIRRRPLGLSEELCLEADTIRQGWSPFTWTSDQTARILFLHIFVPQEEAAAGSFLWEVFDTADMPEQMAIFAALPVLPFPDAYIGLAAEGLRTNMVPVFDAIALNNPYARDYFEEADWNQLFLKAAFMGRPLYHIEGVEERANAELSRMILDYVFERWAAGREVSPEIWRPTCHFLTPPHLEALEKLSRHPDELQRAAASLAISAAYGRAAAGHSGENGTTWTWQKIGRAWENRTSN